MDRYVESLLPQDLLLEMDLDHRLVSQSEESILIHDFRMNKCISRTSLGSRSIDDSSLDMDIGDYLPNYQSRDRKEIAITSQSEESKWETKILPLCMQFIRTYISHSSSGSPIDDFLGKCVGVL